MIVNDRTITPPIHDPELDRRVKDAGASKTVYALVTPGTEFGDGGRDDGGALAVGKFVGLVHKKYFTPGSLLFPKPKLHCVV